MTQRLLTQSCEEATITLTDAGSGSDAKLLKNRDLRVKAINKTGTDTIMIELDFGTSTTVDYVLLGNLYSSNNIDVDIRYWNGSSYVVDTSTSGTFANVNRYFALSATRTATKYRIDFSPVGAALVELSCIFLGQKFDFTYPYDYNNSRVSLMRGEFVQDSAGYPYAQIHSSNKRRVWEVVFSLTASELDDLEDRLVAAGYHMKPVFFYDDNVDTDYHLCRLDMTELRAEQPGRDYFKLPMRIVEI